MLPTQLAHEPRFSTSSEDLCVLPTGRFLRQQSKESGLASGGLASLPSFLQEEDLKQCPGGCGFQVTWHETHCCGRCAMGTGHGFRCDRRPQHGTFRASTSDQSRRELVDYLAHALWPQFTFTVIEDAYTRHSTSKKQKLSFNLWIISSLALVSFYLPYLLGFAVTGLSYFPDWSSVSSTAIMLEVIKISIQVAISQSFYVWSKVAHKRILLDTKFVIAGIAWGLTVILTDPRRAGIMLANNPEEFFKDDWELTLGLLVVAIIVIIVNISRATRSWVLPAIVWPVYSLSLILQHAVGMSPHILTQSIGAIVIVGGIVGSCWLSCCHGESYYRLNWLRLHLLSDTVGVLEEELREKVSECDDPYAVLAEAVAEEDEAQIQACKAELLEMEMEPDWVDEKIAAMRKTNSEQAGVSVAYILSDEFEELVQRLTGMEDPTFEEMKRSFWQGDSAIGKDMRCPRDGELGCSLLDTLPKAHRKNATHFLSWLWSYRLKLVRAALERWIHNEGIDPEKTFLFMCFFNNNQYRVLVAGSANGSDDLDVVFEGNLRRIGRLIAILDGWDSPLYLKRIWTCFEQLTAIQLDLPVTMVLPPEAVGDLLGQFHDGTEGILRVRDALCNIDSEQAKATYAADEETVKSLIVNTVGFAAVNHAISNFMVQWVAKQVQTYMSRLVKNPRATTRSLKRISYLCLESLSCKGFSSTALDRQGSQESSDVDGSASPKESVVYLSQGSSAGEAEESNGIKAHHRAHSEAVRFFSQVFRADDMVTVMKRGRMQGRIAKVVDPYWHDLVKVEMVEDDSKGRLKTYRPEELEVIKEPQPSPPGHAARPGSLPAPLEQATRIDDPELDKSKSKTFRFPETSNALDGKPRSRAVLVVL